MVVGHVGIDSVAVFCGRIEEVHRLWGEPDEIAPEDFFRVYDFHCWHGRGVEMGVDAAGHIDEIFLVFGDHGRYGCFAGTTAEGLVLGPDTREEEIVALYGLTSGPFAYGSVDFQELCAEGEPFAMRSASDEGVALTYPHAGYLFEVKDGRLRSMRFLDCGP